MYTLYARPGSGSFAIEALMAELGLPVKLIDILRKPDKSIPAEFYDVNPRGEVPALLLPNDKLMTESAAILIYLADLNPEAGLAPAVTSADRADYLRWIMYFASAVYMADLRAYYPDRYSTEKGAAPGIKAAAMAHMDRDSEIFAEWLGEKKFVLGDRFSAADVYVAMLLSWMLDLPQLWKRHPNLKAYYDRVSARPAIAAAWRRNNMP